MGGGGNPFADPKFLANLASNPKTRGLLADPEVQQLVGELQRDPNSIAKLLNHPKASQLLGAMLGGMGGPGGEAGPGGESTMFEDDVDDEVPTPASAEAAAEKAAERAKERAEAAKKAEEAAKKAADPRGHLKPEQRAAEEEKDLGNAAYKAKDFDKAIAHYDKAFEHDATNITYLTNKAAVYFEQEKTTECIELCEKAIEVGRENKADYKLIAKAYARIGNAWNRKKDWARAIKFYNHSLSEHRNPDVLKKKQGIEKELKEQERLAYINPEEADKEKTLGNEEYKKGSFPAAMSHYNEAIKRNPQDPKIFRNRAACYSKLMEFNLALSDCEQAIKIDPTFVKAYVQKGATLVVLKETSKAMAAYAKAIELDPECSEAINGYRTCAMETNSNPEETRQRAMQDPEVQEILRDPSMRLILEQMQTDRNAVQEHLKNPEVKAKIQKLIESGLIQVR